MQHLYRIKQTGTVLVFGLALITSLALGQTLRSDNDTNNGPLIKVLPRFESPSVPGMSPEEVEPPNFHPGTPQTDDLPGKGMAQHPMLYIGEGYNKMFLVNHGKVVWTYSTGPGNEYDDVWMLSNGNILFTRMQYIAEITPEKKVVWRYDAVPGTEIHACQPIGKDKVLFIVNGLPPRLMVVNIKTHAVEVDHVLPAMSATDPKSVHAQFRRVRYTAQGTYLLPFLEMNRVVEYDKNFKEIWSYDIAKPWAAIRLKNGNTLITDESDVTTQEVNPKKETVWEVSKADIPAQYWYGNSQSVTRLANGNTIICSRGGDHHGPQLVEITPDKKVVWVLQDWQDFGPATAVQVLDEPGIPEQPGDSLH
ncbi:hypothetical protein [Granulicella sp. L46]|jgi:hypothetical protein|uniref:beta-propeller domain-containing protein n=1 Tax=Granulicella sp. L46 TaxID=1641865 RepID=UPI00131CBBF9|nr:hypothetical protein [Granulicella sp. L46]